MYSIQGLDTVFDVMAYTVAAMKQSGFMPGEIEDYIYDAVKDNCNLICIEVSKEHLEECNKSFEVEIEPERDWFEDTWRDHYYSSLWDDDGERYSKSKWDDDDDDYLTGNKKSHNIWDDDNVFNDLKDDDEEAYEGFSSCKNHRWDCTVDDDDDFDDWKLRSKFDYFDEMKSEDDLEPSYDPFNDPDNNETMDDF